MTDIVALLERSDSTLRTTSVELQYSTVVGGTCTPGPPTLLGTRRMNLVSLEPRDEPGSHRGLSLYK